MLVHKLTALLNQEYLGHIPGILDTMDRRDQLEQLSRLVKRIRQDMELRAMDLDILEAALRRLKD